MNILPLFVLSQIMQHFKSNCRVFRYKLQAVLMQITTGFPAQ